MKTFAISIVLVVAAMLSSCNGNTNDKQFNPKDRTSSSLSDEEREAAIAAKKAQINIDIVQMTQTRAVKLSVFPPAVEGDNITEDFSERIAVKMLQAIAQNGLGGLNTSPIFALAAKLSQPKRETTGTAPQKMLVQYEVNYQVMNIPTGDVYATCSETVTGVGRSWEEAMMNAADEVKSTPALQQTLNTGSERIIAWYNDNLATFKSQVDAAYGRGDYALALALIESVPEQASEAFKYAQGRHGEVMTKFQNAIATNELATIKALLAEADGNVPSEVYAHTMLLPEGSSQLKEARQAIEACQANMTDRANSEAQRAHELELASIEAERIKAKYEADAAVQIAQANGDRCRGFWASLGSRILTAIDKTSTNEN